MADINTQFIEAARKKIRFGTSQGQLAVEDLFDLSLPSLDKIAVALDAQLQQSGRKSFIDAPVKGLAETQLAFDIAKYVIDVKLAEKAEAKLAAERKSQVDFLKGLLEKKQLAELEGMTTEQITAKLAELGVAA